MKPPMKQIDHLRVSRCSFMPSCTRDPRNKSGEASRASDEPGPLDSRFRGNDD